MGNAAAVGWHLLYSELAKTLHSTGDIGQGLLVHRDKLLGDGRNILMARNLFENRIFVDLLGEVGLTFL